MRWGKHYSQPALKNHVGENMVHQERIFFHGIFPIIYEAFIISAKKCRITNGILMSRRRH